MIAGMKPFMPFLLLTAAPLPANGGPQPGAITLHISAALIGTGADERVRVCRTLLNRSTSGAIVERGWATYAYTLFLDRWDAPFRDPGDTAMHHGGFVPPPPPLPSGEPDPTAFLILNPHKSLTDCVNLSLPTHRRYFRVRTVYSPAQGREWFPRARPNAVVVSREQGRFHSNRCFVDILRRHVTC